MDRGRFRAADVDRQQPVTALLFAQQHHWGVRRDFDPDTDQFYGDHTWIVPPARGAVPSALQRCVARYDSAQTAQRERCGVSAERIIAARN